MFDETTDVRTIEQMIIHARYMNENGEVTTKFMKILDCLESNDCECDANEISTTISLNADKISGLIVNFIEENDLSYEKLVGLGTDGAAVMVGKENGAVKKIVDRQISKQNANVCKALGQRCAAHKLNLAASKAGNYFPPIVRFKKILHKLHGFYSRSAVRTKGLESVQKLLSESLGASGKVQDPSDTRWLALGKCTLGLKKILPSVLLSLERESEERGDVVAAGLFHMMSKWEFIAILLLLCDILPTVNRLSCQFQEASVDFSQIELYQQATVKALEAKKAKSIYDSNFQSLVESISKNGIKVEVQEEKLSAFNTNVKIPFIDQLTANISGRFQNTHVMEAFAKFADRSNYDPEKQDALCNSVTILTEQFGLETDEALREISDICHYIDALIALQAADDVGPSFVDMMVTSKTALMFPTLSKLAQIYITLPPHTADCERGFSKMKLIKTDARNRMGEDSLDSLMRISINGPPAMFLTIPRL